MTAITNSIDRTPHDRPAVVRHAAWKERKIKFRLNSVTTRNALCGLIILDVVIKIKMQLLPAQRLFTGLFPRRSVDVPSVSLLLQLMMLVRLRSRRPAVTKRMSLALFLPNRVLQRLFVKYIPCSQKRDWLFYDLNDQRQMNFYLVSMWKVNRILRLIDSKFCETNLVI